MAKPTNINILNSIRKEVSLTYQSRIPEATRENLDTIYTDMMKYKPLRDELASALVKQIGLITIDSMMFKNPLGKLKKDPIHFGNTHEEIFVNMIKGTSFDNRAGIEKAFAIYESNIMAMYHRINFEQQYPVTISYQNMRDAFTSSYGIRDLITAKVQQCFSSANYDEYLVMKNLAEVGYKNGYLYPVTVPEVTDENSSNIMLENIKEYADNMTFPCPEYNFAGATSFSTPNTLVFITTPKVNSRLGVRSLAYMFNEDKASINIETIKVDKFDNPNIQGILCDIRFFNVREQFREFSDNYNGASLNWNYFYTVVEMISASPFYPCVVFTKQSTSVTSIEAENIASYTPGSEIQITYKVSGADNNYVPQEVDFELTGETKVGTLIVPGTNTLIIDPNETATLSIKIVSRYKESVTKTITATKTA